MVNKIICQVFEHVIFLLSQEGFDWNGIAQSVGVVEEVHTYNSYIVGSSIQSAVFKNVLEIA